MTTLTIRDPVKTRWPFVIKLTPMLCSPAITDAFRTQFVGRRAGMQAWHSGDNPIIKNDVAMKYTQNLMRIRPQGTPIDGYLPLFDQWPTLTSGESIWNEMLKKEPGLATASAVIAARVTQNAQGERVINTTSFEIFDCRTEKFYYYGYIKDFVIIGYSYPGAYKGGFDATISYKDLAFA